MPRSVLDSESSVLDSESLFSTKKSQHYPLLFFVAAEKLNYS